MSAGGDDDKVRGETSLPRLLSSLHATLHPETYVFATIPEDKFNYARLPIPLEDICLFFREPRQGNGATTTQSVAPSSPPSSSSPASTLTKGTHEVSLEQGQGTTKRPSQSAITLILRLETARQHNLPQYTYPCKMITCAVHSSLEAVGFMAVLATRLAQAGISVNPVSGFYHDHLFVPVGRAAEAVAVLVQVRDEAARDLAGECPLDQTE
ncbi:ACT domain-containing protein [Cladophialophora immunda]|nr:ACT domain-containing protein [Cladophialophora immunda]